MAVVRTFIALELPGVVRQHLAGVIGKLALLGDRVRWSRPEGSHLTLKFLGDVAVARIPEVVAATRAAVRDEAPLTLCTSNVGGFPHLQRAQVVWVGVGGDRERLCGLQARLDALLTPLGFAPERRKFVPHLTLGRARRGPVDVGAPEAVQPVHFQVDRLTVMQSDLRPEGPIYSPLGYGLLNRA